MLVALGLDAKADGGLAMQALSLRLASLPSEIMIMMMAPKNDHHDHLSHSERCS